MSIRVTCDGCSKLLSEGMSGRQLSDAEGPCVELPSPEDVLHAEVSVHVETRDIARSRIICVCDKPDCFRKAVRYAAAACVMEIASSPMFPGVEEED